MSDLPATRAEALALGLKHYFTGKPCKHGHIAKRLASTGACLECGLKFSRKWREANPDKMRGYKRKWRAANPEKHRAQSRESARKWKAANREKHNEKVRKWLKRNPEKRAAWQSARNARKIKATPPWADLEAIKVFYAKCARVSAETGIKHHVDHIVPLKGRTVCGLHVPWNLRVIPAAENIAKGNKVGEGEIETARKLERNKLGRVYDDGHPPAQWVPFGSSADT